MAVKSSFKNMSLCLLAICLACSALLAGVYALTAEPIAAAAAAKNTTVGEKLSLDHVESFMKEMEEAGIKTDAVSPKLLPRYTHGNPVFDEPNAKLMK